MRRRAAEQPVFRGFTIVELLIVIVVVAILVAVTIVAYNGITAQAKESTLKSDLTSAVKQLKVNRIQDGGDFPTSKPSYLSGSISYAGGGNGFCVSGKSNGKAFHADEDGAVQEGHCPPPTTMQAMTPGYCSSMAIYTGSNPSAVLSLTDSRGGTTRTYDVAKLADGNCWMLTNLKLGSTSGPITLTPSDSNVASNFTLPQVIATGWSNADTPVASGPVPGDTGSGATNYGYLYNWSAATAGESRTTSPAGSDNAPYSICPAGWRLPTGDPTGEFAWLNAKMNNPAAAYPSTAHGTDYYPNWHYSGPFRGSLSGYWGGSFQQAGTFGYLWSASTHVSLADYAYSIGITTSNPHLTAIIGANSRGLNYGVRCLLN